MAEVETSPQVESPTVELDVVQVADAPQVVEVILAAFGARAQIDPPPPALAETVDTVAAEIARGSGVVARIDGRVAGVILLPPGQDGTTRLQRVSVHPAHQRLGLATAMVDAVCELAALLGNRRVELFCRKEFPAVVSWWRRMGFHPVAEQPHGFDMVRDLPVRLVAPDAEAMRAIGVRLAGLLRPGDVVIATGELGAGKTTLTQGIGAGLGITEAVTSPTFVLSRIHRTDEKRPDLVHVDAYRLTDAAELDDIDLDSDASRSVTVVEWGTGLAEQLSDDRLEIEIRRSGDPDDETRELWLTGVGERWAHLADDLATEEAHHE